MQTGAYNQPEPVTRASLEVPTGKYRPDQLETRRVLDAMVLRSPSVCLV